MKMSSSTPHRDPDDPTPPTDLLDPGERSLDWGEIGHRVREKSWLVLLCGLAGLCLTSAYTRRIPEVYRATAVLQIDPEEQRVLGFDGGSGGPSGGEYATEAAVGTVLESLRSRALLTRVVGANRLAENRDFLPADANGKSPGVAAAADALGGLIAIQVRKGTRLVDVAVSHHDPHLAQALVNSLTDEFIQSKIEQRAASSQAVMTFLLKEAERLKDRLQKSDEAMQAYKETHDALSLEERQDTVVGKLRSQAAQFNDARATRIRLEATRAELQLAAGKREVLLAHPTVAGHPTLTALRDKVQALQTQILTLGLRYTEKHPKMIQAHAQLADAQATLESAALRVPQLIQTEYERALATERNFEQALQGQEKLALTLDKQAISYKVLAREMETNRALYDAVLRRLKETDVAKGVELQNVRVFEAAALPASPNPRHTVRLLALGLVGGLGGGFLVVLAAYFLDPSWKNVDQAETATSLRVLAAVPKCGRMSRAASGRMLLDQPASAAAEAFRFLRTSLYLKAHHRPGRSVFLFTSAMPGEGKTFCAVNGAVAIAQQGLRTLIVDADLRSPDVGESLLENPDVPGLGEYLLGRADFDQVVHASKTPNLSVIPAGQIAPHPSEMLARSEFGRLIVEARANFDLIVIDSAPIHPVSDTLLVLEHVDAVCLVVRLDYSAPKAVLRACQVLAQFGRPPTGLIMNAVPRRANAPYYCAADSYGNRGYQPALPAG